MDNMLEKILEYIMMFRKKQNRNSTYSYNIGGNKTYMSSTEHLTFNSQTEAIKAKVREDVQNLHKEFNGQPEKILKYVENAGTKVYRIMYADKLLEFIGGEEEGVIFEQSGLKALILSFVTEKQFKFKTKPMFVLRNGIFDYLSMLHNFYRWYSWTQKLPGFDERSQWLFKRYMKYPNADLSKLSIEDIIKAEEAVARDKEATNFCLDIAKETVGARNVQKKLNEEGGANI